MPAPKIVIIGAGSLSFGLGCLQDAMLTPSLKGAELVLVDLDEEKLTRTYRLAQLLNQESGAELKIAMTVDRTAALPGANYVITAVEIKRNDLWRKDWEIPLKHGLKHVLGENGGPGGLFHTLRMVPVLLEIARDMERYCPDALLINFSNPESRLTLAVAENTRIKAVGLCHGLQWQRWKISQYLNMDQDDIFIQAAGVNHFTWIQKLKDRRTGEDLYPKLAALEKTWDPLCQYLYQVYGLYPSPSDDHSGEYIGWSHHMVGLHGHDFAADDRHREEMDAKLAAMLAGERPVTELLARKSGEEAFDIIAAHWSGTPLYQMALVLSNREGLIPGLPAGCTVEVPGYVDTFGVHGLKVEPLPAGIMGMLHREATIQMLTVEAAVKGDRRLALQALLLDPVVTDPKAAEACLAELFEVHAPYLPTFQ